MGWRRDGGGIGLVLGLIRGGLVRRGWTSCRAVRGMRTIEVVVVGIRVWGWVVGRVGKAISAGPS